MTWEDQPAIFDWEQPGVFQIRFDLPTLTDAPTVAELAAGTDLAEWLGDKSWS